MNQKQKIKLYLWLMSTAKLGSQLKCFISGLFIGKLRRQGSGLFFS